MTLDRRQTCVNGQKQANAKRPLVMKGTFQQQCQHFHRELSPFMMECVMQKPTKTQQQRRNSWLKTIFPRRKNQHLNE